MLPKAAITQDNRDAALVHRIDRPGDWREPIFKFLQGIAEPEDPAELRQERGLRTAPALPLG